jgi:hypothetical protein
MKLKSFFASLVVLFVTGCSSSTVGLAVTKGEMGDDWPLTIDEGLVSCDGTKAWGRLYFEHDGRRFAINGAALMDEAKTPDIDTSGWLVPNPRIQGSFKSLDSLMDKARSDCE